MSGNSIEMNRIDTPARSDQFNFEDFLTGPRDFTIESVEDPKGDAPYDIRLVGEKRVWRPPLTVLRLLKKAWGTDQRSEWAGRRVRLYGDDTITVGPKRMGGIRVSHASHITEPVTADLQERRGVRTPRTVQPLPADEPPTPEPTQPEPTAEEVASCTDRDQLRAWWKNASTERREQITQRVADLDNEPSDA